MTWLDELKIEDLRGDYAELAAVIGLELTLQVAEELGGAPLVLPYLGELRHPDQLRSGYFDLHAVVGWELTVKVAAVLGGGQLYLPQAKHLVQAAKERYILRHDRVHNRRQLARATQLSLRHVYRICAGKPRQRGRVDDSRQLDWLAES